MPFILVYRTHNFWMTENLVYEQPQVTHLNELVAVVYTKARTYTFATTKDLNELVGNAAEIAPTISIDNIDLNKDGKNDEIRVKIGLGNIKAEDLKAAMIVQSVKYEIRDSVDAQFKLPFFNVFQSPRGGFSKLDVKGSINLKQQETFMLGAIKRGIGFDHRGIADNLMEMNYMDLASNVLNQNVTGEFEVMNEYWMDATPGAN